MPVTEIRSFANGEKCLLYSKPNNFIIIIDVNKKNESSITIRTEKDGLGKMMSFQIDSSELYLICTLNTNKVGIYDIATGQLLTYSEQRNFNCEGSFIDEAGCFITMLDETMKKINIFVIDWTYKVDKPPKKKRRLSSVSSLESGGPIRD